MEGLPVPEYELCHCHAMTVKHLLTDCTNLAGLRLRFFDGSNPNMLKQILGIIKVNSKPMKFVKESNFLTRSSIKMKEKITKAIQGLMTYL